MNAANEKGANGAGVHSTKDVNEEPGIRFGTCSDWGCPSAMIFLIRCA